MATFDPAVDTKGQEQAEEDVWAVVVKKDSGPTWREKTHGQRFVTVLVIFLKLCTLLALLYLFVCSLGLLSDAFRLLGGKTAGEAFRSNSILSNPVAGLMMGILATVLLQSSSTTTSIVVSMVAADSLPIRPAIFIIMGANIGTSVTNTIVSLGQVYDRNEFRRAFAGAVVHDMFNWLSVIILMPIEWLSGSFGTWKDCGILCQLTKVITKDLTIPDKNAKRDFLKIITKPFTSVIIQLDKSKVELIANNPNVSVSEVDLIKHKCSAMIPEAYMNNETEQCAIRYVKGKIDCEFMFADISKDWSNAAVGGCLLVFALFLLMFCLIMIVRLLHSMLRGAVARIIQKVLNAKIPYVKWLTGYIAILVGTGLTMLLQSSSIFTSAMTPLVGAGVLHLKRMYPLTLGANIGTTFTAMLAAFASDEKHLALTMQVALCHFFFNILGILIWYPVPFMRKVPISLAKALGNKTAKHRWFAGVYLVIMFLLLPAAIFGLSVAGWKVALGVLLPLFLIFVAIVVINVMQRKCPHAMAPRMRTWNWCPRAFHTLSFYDSMCDRCKCCGGEEAASSDGEEAVVEVRGERVDLVEEGVSKEPPPYYKNKTFQGDVSMNENTPNGVKQPEIHGSLRAL